MTETLHSLASNLLAWIEASKYVLLFLGSLFEGPVLMLSSGFLWRIGQLDFWPMYFILVLGDFTADITWYFIGRHGARRFIDRFGARFNVTPAIVLKIEERFKKYQNWILIISKLTMGFGFAVATLLVAGMLKVPFLRYVLINFFGGFVWTLLLITIGYLFGNIYYTVIGPLRIVVLLVVVIGGFFAFRFANKYLIQKDFLGQ